MTIKYNFPKPHISDASKDRFKSIAGNEELDTQWATTFNENIDRATRHNEQKEYEQGATTLEQAATILEQAIKTLQTTLNTKDLELQAMLALTYANQGLYDKAIPLQEDVVKMNETTFGKQHSHTLKSMQNLACFYINGCKYKEAIMEQTKVVDTAVAMFGKDNLDSLEIKRDLAIMLMHHDQLRRTEAETLIEEVHEALVRTLEPEHHYTLVVMYDLASARFSLGRHDPAITLLEELIDISKRKHGKPHEHTVDYLNCLMEWCEIRGLKQKAEDIKIELAKAKEQLLGHQYPDTLPEDPSQAGGLEVKRVIQ